MANIGMGSSASPLGFDSRINKDRKEQDNDGTINIKNKKDTDKNKATAAKKSSSGISTDAASKGKETTNTAGVGISRNNLIMSGSVAAGTEAADKLHVSFNMPSTEEVDGSSTYKLPPDIDKTMKKFFLNPLNRDMTLRVITLFLDSLSKEFSNQLDVEIVQTKAKVASIMSQKDQLVQQAQTKLIGGIVESAITGVAAAASISSSVKGLKMLKSASSELNEATESAEQGIQEAEENISQQEEELAENKNILQNMKEEKMKPNSKITDKDITDKEKKVEDLEKSLNEYKKKTIPKFEDEIKKAQSTKDLAIRKADMLTAKLTAFSQLIGSTKGVATGLTDYMVTMQQANMKLQDAVQAGIQLNKDNAKMFMQKSNEYISTVLNALLSIISSKYQARRGIITS